MATRLYLRAHLDAHGWTRAELVRRLDGRISQTVTYRLVDDVWACLKRDQLDALADVFHCAPGALLAPPEKARRPPPSGTAAGPKAKRAR